jgi:hypothetical protein
MKTYNSGCVEDLTEGDIQIYISDRHFKFEMGIIKSASILERKLFSNKGNALDCWISLGDGRGTGLNIGGNPIGTGYNNYIHFLDEMECKKSFGLYKLESLVGKVVCRFGNEFMGNYISPKEFSKLDI